MIGLYFTEILLVLTRIVTVQGLCEDGYWGSDCSKMCSDECKTITCTSSNGFCEECNVGSFGSKCQYSCPTNCLNSICSQSETCTDGCQKGFYGFSCFDVCPPNCKTNECDFDGSCSSICKAGYYGDICDQECIGSVCVNNECYQNNGTCMASCPATCSLCSSMLACTACKAGYYGKTCEQECIGTACVNNECVQTDGTCMVSCPATCSSCSSMLSCTTCKSGFFRPTCDTECSDSSCLECDKITGVCIDCKSGYFGPTCDSKCSDTNCSECDKTTGVCTKCGTGFYFSGSLCLQCTIGCTECTDSGITSCSSCSSAFYLDTSTCTKCADGCKMCDLFDNCNECIDGHFKVLNSQRCEKCPRSCKTCTSEAQCTACGDGYYGLTCNNACMDSCSICSNLDNCTTCAEYRYSSKGNSGSLTCDCDTQRCSHQIGDICISCSNPTWYPSEPGCCPCGEGSYVDNSECVLCSEHCVPQGQCNQINGACIDDCEAEWWGTKCDQKCNNQCINCSSLDGSCASCKPGVYGIECTASCSDGCGMDENGTRMCAQTEGTCNAGCIEGYHGTICTQALTFGQEPTNTGTIVGVVVGSIGCVAFLVIAAVLILRRKRPLCQKSGSREDSNEQGNAENTDPTLSLYEDLRYRPGNDMLYGNLEIENSTGEENAIRPLYENVQESDVNETNTPDVRLYGNLVL